MLATNKMGACVQLAMYNLLHPVTSALASSPLTVLRLSNLSPYPEIFCSCAPMDPNLVTLATCAWDASTDIIDAMEAVICKLQQLSTDDAQERAHRDQFSASLYQIIHDIEICRHTIARSINQDNIYLSLPQIQENMLFYFRFLDVVERMVALQTRLQIFAKAVAPRVKELPIRHSS